ncbi:MAG: HipA domain-containing protein [Pseudomonadota bacterium]
MKKEQRRIEVWAHWAPLPQPVFVGILYASPSRGKEIFSFEYSPDWLKNTCAQSFDPSLELYKGLQYAPQGKENFGVFLDSAPDRWGRILMRRREAQAAREEKRKERVLHESDYLLGVYDGHRMGALRFRTASDGPFLDDNTELAVPPWTSLRELEHASLELEKNGAEKNRDYGKWLRMLMAPGASLGGARPKAGIIDEKGGLWIAKFPSAHDEVDSGAWEKVIHKLAMQCRIETSESLSRTFGSRHHTFLTRRFDRTETRERIHFASAMTLLQRSDGDDASTGASYLELAEFIIRQGAEPNHDLEELWRRIIFFICTSNADDHLRNHGFLLSPTGWRLSPAYDMNPVPAANGLRLNISETDNAQNLELAREIAPFFRVKSGRVTEIIKQVTTQVRSWRKIAKTLRISAGEIDRMARAFRIAEEV